MPEDVDDEFARRLREVSASIAGLDEEEALQVLDVRLKQAQANGQARHQLSLARARGTLALALGSGAEHDIIASLETMVSTIEESGPAQVVLLPTPAQATDPELAANLTELLQLHHQNAVDILHVIAQLSVAGDTGLVRRLEEFLEYDLSAISELQSG